MWYGQVSSGGAQTLVFSPDARTLYTGDTVGQVTAWDVATGAGRKLVARTDPLANGHFHLSADGRHLVYRYSSDFVVRDAGTGDVLSRHPVPQHMFAANTLSPCGRYFLGPDSAAQRLYRWDWVAGAEADPVPFAVEQGFPFEYTALHPDGATAARRVWVEGMCWVVLFDGPTGVERWRARVGHVVSQLRFDPAGRRLLALGEKGQALALDAATGQELWASWPAPATRDPGFVAFHPTRPLVAVGYVKHGKQHTGAARFVDLDTGAAVAVPDPGFPSAVRVAFSPDGLTCAVAGSNRAFAVFDLEV